MDTRIAVITGTVFAGVLVAGALAAPRIDDGEPGGETRGVTATDISALAEGYDVGYDDDDDDDNDDDDDHHDDDEYDDDRDDDDDDDEDDD